MKSTRVLLLTLAAAMATIVTVRMLFGPFRFGLIAVNTPLNPEGFLGLAVTLLLLTRATIPEPAPAWNRRIAALLALGVAAISILALRRALGLFFLSDDFFVVPMVNAWHGATFLHTITHGGGDGFFRPVSFISLALDASVNRMLGGLNPAVWHATSVGIHTVNSILVLFMARRLGASALAAGFAGALFAVHGIHPEAAAWIDGRFDLLATFFVLSGMLLFTMTEKHISFRWTHHAAALACFALAALSKEAAFIFPLLVAGWALWKRRPLTWTVPYFVVAAILFVYRWSLFGGIGGYTDRATGRPAALTLGVGSTLKAVGVRLWTQLYFPLNWTTDPSLPLALLAVVYIAALLWLGLQRNTARPLWPVAAAILISVIPALSLLAGSPTLAGARVWYLPSVWFAILIAMALDGLPAPSRYGVAVVVLMFQFCALQHNLDFWEAASARVKAECATGAPVLPDWLDGVPAYLNASHDCVEVTRIALGRP